MSFSSINFLGIVNLDQKIVEELTQYLKEKESRLAHRLLRPIQSLSDQPSLPDNSSLKLSEAVERLSRGLRLLKRGREKAIENGEPVIKEINKAFWEFTEVLEGSVVELFQQIRQIPLHRWHVSISPVVHAIKMLLLHHLEEMVWAIHRLEKPVSDYLQIERSTSRQWLSFTPFKKEGLDRHLLRNLRQTEQYLKTQYEAFHQRYTQYMHLSVQIENELQIMKGYPILALLEVQEQNLYVDIFRLLKIFEMKRLPKKELSLESVRALKQLASVDHVIQLFRLYYRELKGALFSSSLEWKSLNREEGSFKDAALRLKGKIQEYKRELQQLIQTISRYRTFTLQTDSNPYVRSRWGFTEWIVGPEPVPAKRLLHLSYAIEELEGHFNEFSESLTDALVQSKGEEWAPPEEIDRLLHEMGQPLISRAMMRERGEELLTEIKNCNELGSPFMAVIPYTEEILSKAMRVDWKYHVLHEFPLFHQLYRLHQGLAEYFEDPAHAFRLDHFHQLFDQIEDWVDKGDVYSHVHEIEMDMNDMKTYLQDFLASIQRIAKEGAQDPFLNYTLRKFRQHLLEYRYIFGQFFSIIMAKSTDGQQLRIQFLFVDQYFEAMENLITELKTIEEKKSQENL